MAANTEMVDMVLLRLPNVVGSKGLIHHAVRGLRRHDDRRIWRDQIGPSIHEGLLWFSARSAAAGGCYSGGIPDPSCRSLWLQHLKAQLSKAIDKQIFIVVKQ